MQELCSLKDAAATVQSGATIVALCVGAVWAIFRFSRGRVFRPRITLKASTKVVRKDRIGYLLTTIVMENVGQSRVKIDKGSCVLLVYPRKKLSRAPAFISKLAKDGRWPHSTFRVFEQRDRPRPKGSKLAELWRSLTERDAFWIEPGATQTMIQMLALPGYSVPSNLAYLVECTIVASKAFWERRGTVFRTDTIFVNNINCQPQGGADAIANH